VQQKTRFILYLIVIHLAVAGTMVYLLRAERIWILAVEAALALSLWYGIRLVLRLFGTLDLIHAGRDYIADGDFTVRFSETGQPELDRLIQVYNRMLDRLRHERQHTAEQDYFMQKILHSSPTGVITLDHDGMVVQANPAAGRMLHLTESDTAGRKLSDLPGQLPSFLATLGVGQTKVRSLQGGRRVRCRCARFMDRGFPRRFYLLDELTEELRRSEKASYGKLIRMMSHEVNNTVAATGSLLQSCLAYAPQLTTDDRGDFQTALRTVIGRARELNRFMSHFAEVVRVPDPERRAADPRRLMADVVSLMEADLKRQGIRVTWDVNGPVPEVALDRSQMERVFVNLLRNAGEAMDGGGTINLGFDALADGGCRIRVEDDGPGVPPEVREKLFSPFFSTKPDGQGIGLTLVQEILLRHHFDFSLESRPERGACFTILCPPAGMPPGSTDRDHPTR